MPSDADCMPASRLIVCEKTGRWAAALRGAGANVSSVRSLAQCEAAIAAEAGVAAVEITPANLEATVHWLSRVALRPGVHLAALLPAELSAAEPLLREAGAIDMLSSVSAAPRLARLAARGRRAETPAMSLSELVSQRLPWPQRASASA